LVHVAALVGGISVQERGRVTDEGPEAKKPRKRRTPVAGVDTTQKHSTGVAVTGLVEPSGVREAATDEAEETEAEDAAETGAAAEAESPPGAVAETVSPTD